MPAMRQNLAVLRGTIGPEPQLGLVAKADAYGHGLVPIGRFAVQNGVNWILVATVQEGISLRDAGIDAPILVLSPILPIEAEQAVFYRLRTLTESDEIAHALNLAAEGQGVRAIVHLAVDTGVSRFGATPVEASELAMRIRHLPFIDLEGIGSHFADSGANAERTEEQIRKFDAVVKVCEANGIHFKIHHLSNSAGTVRYPSARHELVRVGIASYGIDPYGLYPDGTLKPMMTWKARIMAMRERPAGTWVSYGSTCHLERTTRVATLGVGYGDGYPRSLSNVGFVEIHGVRCAVLGLVCMDQLLVDATDLPSVEIGDEATLLGPTVPVNELAELSGTNCHEIITRIMSRVPRRYKY